MIKTKKFKLAYERIDNVFEKFCSCDNGCSVSKAIELFKPILDDLNFVYEKYAKEANDYRTGEETYGYKSEESILENLSYISDRWACAFRIKWVIDLIQRSPIHLG